MPEQPTQPAIFEQLFKRGLGELPMLRKKERAALLGNLVMDKGRLVFKDRGLLAGVSAADVAPCWDLGIIGAVADVSGKEWESLTFLGPDHCTIPVNLSSTRHNVLGRSIGAQGENLLAYTGSIYRGFKLMLDSNLLPLVLPLPIDTAEGVQGLAVTDFRFATVSLDVVRKANDLVRAAVDKHMTLSVEEVDIDDAEFDQMFAQYRQAEEA